MRVHVPREADAETAAAITAAVSLVMNVDAQDVASGIPVWRLAGLRDGVASHTPLQPMPSAWGAFPSPAQP